MFACMYAATLTQFTAMTPTSVFQAGFRCTHFAFRNHPPRTNKNPQFSLKSSFLPGNSDLDLPHLPTSRQRRRHTGLHELFRAFDPGLPRHLHASQTKRVPKRAAEHPTLNGPTPGERGRNAPSRSPTDSIQPNRRDSGTPESVVGCGCWRDPVREERESHSRTQHPRWKLSNGEFHPEGHSRESPREQ